MTHGARQTGNSTLLLRELAVVGKQMQRSLDTHLIDYLPESFAGTRPNPSLTVRVAGTITTGGTLV